jgi:hypothetical protein
MRKTIWCTYILLVVCVLSVIFGHRLASCARELYISSGTADSLFDKNVELLKMNVRSFLLFSLCLGLFCLPAIFFWRGTGCGTEPVRESSDS